MPVVALALSSLGMLTALLVNFYSGERAYVHLLGVAFFGGLFAWGVIFATHLRFRRRYRGTPAFQAPWYPWTSLAGLLGVLAVLVSTWWIPGLRVTLLAGLPWLALVTVWYFVWRRLSSRTA